jgi:hypothetical protein
MGNRKSKTVRTCPYCGFALREAHGMIDVLVCTGRCPKFFEIVDALKGDG